MIPFPAVVTRDVGQHVWLLAYAVDFIVVAGLAELAFFLELSFLFLGVYDYDAGI